MRADPVLAMCSVGELFGGVERHLLGMCSWLIRQEKAPLLILFHDAELAQQARKLGVEPIIIPARGSFDLQGPRRLAAILAEHGVDVVHAHGYRAVVNCAMAHAHHRFQLVRTVHGLVEPSGIFTLTWLKSMTYTWLERFWGRRVGAAVTYVTDDLRRKHERMDHGLRAMTIFNGIDPLSGADFDQPPEFETEVFQVVVVGRVSAVKGLPYALSAIEQLSDGPVLRLNIIGTGPLMEELTVMVQERGLAGRVKILGFRDNIYDYMAHADALLMPSLHEGAPYTILEAMSLGVPIVASRTGGLPELIEDGESGQLVGVGDVEGLAKSLMELRDNPERCRLLGEAGRLRQAERFDLDTMGETFWDLYCSVLKSNGAQ